MDNLFKATNTNDKRNTKKLGLKAKKDKTIESLKEVEHFLCQTKKAINYIKLYKKIQ